MLSAGNGRWLRIERPPRLNSQFPGQFLSFFLLQVPIMKLVYHHFGLPDSLVMDSVGCKLQGPNRNILTM